MTIPKVREAKKRVMRLLAGAKDRAGENEELEEEVAGLEAAVLERERLCELQGEEGGGVELRDSDSTFDVIDWV